MSNCPETDTLSDLVFGNLADGPLVSVSEHLVDCEKCQRTVEELELKSDVLLNVLRQPIPDEPLMNEDGCLNSILRAEAILESDTAAVAGEATYIVSRDSSRTREPDGTVPDLNLGQYRLLSKLGQGGMGTVYEAVHLPLDKLVAIKILPPNHIVDDQAVSRFQREMRAVGRVAHPNIVAALDAGEVNDIHFLVMERVDGADVGKIAHRLKRLRIDDACEIVRQAALGLQHAHDNGLVHRDIKPSNLMLSSEDGADGRLKILDLGLALLQDHHAETDGLTGTGQVMGTIDYMAPEQADDTHRVDGRADVYSLGATLYRLLGGRPPLAAEESGIFQRLSALATKEPDSISSLRPNVPAALADLISRMLSKSPSERPASPGQVAEELQAYANGAGLDVLVDEPHDDYASRVESEAVATDPVPTRIKPESRRRKLMIAGVGLTVALGAALLIPEIRQPETANNDVPSNTLGNNPDTQQTLLPSDRSPDESTQRVESDELAVTTKTDYALYFDGVDDYVELPPMPIVGDSPLTLECLVTMARDYPERRISENGMAHIAGWQNLQGIKLVAYENGPGAKIVFDYDAERKTYPFHYIKSSDSIVGHTSHISLIYKNAQCTLYIDGNPIDTRRYRPYRKPVEGAFLGGYMDTRKSVSRFVSDMAFHGTIDEIRISNKARPPILPEDHPRRFYSDNFTLGLYHCDDVGSSDVLVDSSGNGRHGKIYGSQRIPATDDLAGRMLAKGSEWLKQHARSNPWFRFKVPVVPAKKVQGSFTCYTRDTSGEISSEKWSITSRDELTTPEFDHKLPSSRLGYGTCIYDLENDERLTISPYTDDIFTATIRSKSQSRRAGMAFRDQETMPAYAPATDTRLSRQKYVHSVSVSSDGRYAATIDASGNVTELIVHDVESPDSSRTFALPEDEVLHYGVEFLPGDDRIVAGTVSGDILIFGLATGTVIDRIQRRGRVRSMALSQDGTRLAVGGDSEVGNVEVWDIEQKSLVSRVDQPGIIRAVRFSPDGHTVAVAADNEVFLFDSDSGEIFGRTLRLPDLRSLEFTPEGELLVLPGLTSKRNPYSALLAFDIRDLQKPAREIINLRHNTFHALSMHPTLPVVALSQTYGILFINRITGDVVAAWNIPQPTYWSSDFSADGTVFATVTSNPGGICIWDTEQFASLTSRSSQPVVESGGSQRDYFLPETRAFTPQGRYRVTVPDVDGQLIEDVWTISLNGTIASSQGHSISKTGSALNAFYYSWQGTADRMVLGAGSSDLLVVNLLHDDAVNRRGVACRLTKEPAAFIQPLADRQGASLIHDAALTSDNQRLVWSGRNAQGPMLGFGSVVDEVDSFIVSAPPGIEFQHGVEIIDATSRVIAATTSGSLLTYDIASRRLESRIQGTRKIGCICTSPNGRWLAVGASEDEATVRIYELTEGTLIEELPAKGPVHAIRFSPNSSQLAVADSRTLTLFGTADWEMAHRWLEFANVRSLDFADESTLLLTRLATPEARRFTCVIQVSIDGDRFDVQPLTTVWSDTRVSVAIHQPTHTAALAFKGNVQLFDLRTGRNSAAGRTRLLHDHGSVRFSDDGSRLIIPTGNTITVWDTKSPSDTVSISSESAPQP